MVGVINPANGTSIDAQSEAARSAPYQLSPGQGWPAEGQVSGSTQTGRPLSDGAIAGMVVAAVVALLGMAFLSVAVGRRRRKPYTAPGIDSSQQSPCSVVTPAIFYELDGEKPLAHEVASSSP
jgi:hypothetical protein